MPGLIILVVLLVLAVVIIIAMYNGMVAAREQVNNAWSQIDVQLKRRYDLIPNLIETVKGYMAHEKDTLERVIQARNGAMSATGVQEKAVAEGQVTKALSGIFALAESYPDLKSNENMLSLQEELKSTENKISFARQYYNDAVTAFNTKLQVFPGSLIAGIFSFKGRELFMVDDAIEREPVKVKF